MSRTGEIELTPRLHRWRRRRGLSVGQAWAVVLVIVMAGSAGLGWLAGDLLIGPLLLR